MSGSVGTVDAIKVDKETTPTADQGEEGKETNARNRRGKQSYRRTELVQLHTAHRYFKGDTLEVPILLGLMSNKLDLGTSFDKFRNKLKGSMERNLHNANDMMCVVTDTDDPMICFEEEENLKYLDEEEANSILMKKILEVVLTR